MDPRGSKCDIKCKFFTLKEILLVTFCDKKINPKMWQTDAPTVSTHGQTDMRFRDWCKKKQTGLDLAIKMDAF